MILKPIIRFVSPIGGGFLTDHNRGELGVTFNEVGSEVTTVDGTLRGHVIARKPEYSLTWNLVPSDAGATVDGYWGGQEMLDFYNDCLSEFTVYVYNRDYADKKWLDSYPDDTFIAKFSAFSYSIVKRNVRLNSTTLCDFWNVSLSFKRV